MSAEAERKVVDRFAEVNRLIDCYEQGRTDARLVLEACARFGCTVEEVRYLDDSVMTDTDPGAFTAYMRGRDSVAREEMTR